MNAATINYLIRWSVPVALCIGLFVWGLVLLRIEERQKSGQSDSKPR